ncbi:MAG: tetratricopeptide repeat protein [Xanthomonadales bacterium]|nr:tetratricopeptide repeat protein [Xanthomonadales bacterium]
MLDRVTLSRVRGLTLPAVLALLAACSGPAEPPPQPPAAVAVVAAVQPLPDSADHVGREVCTQCHAREAADWQGSHHDLAMQEADAGSVLGDFDGARFEYAGTTSTFQRRDGRYFVTTDGPDGELAEFEIRYTFGHHPLQQYLIELPGGRLQAFGIAWDSRPQAEGGQRWFHLYPDDALKAGERLHWTGRDQNWNFMCAECHSTALDRNYDDASDTYATRWTEIDVSCEACHGPGLAHARWASEPDPRKRAEDTAKGLAVAFHERRGIAWVPDAETGIARRSAPREGRVEIDACGRCHGRATPLVGGVAHGGSLLDSHRPALLDPDQYWPDGQMRGEVFNWGPFLQSRMQAAGVTCSDCHQPHSLALRAEGNALCAQCHAPERFDQAAHTHHADGSAGARCVACHMPTTTFMQVDARHDHGFRIPRPDPSGELDAPDACTACHADRTAAWAAAALERWFPRGREGPSSFAGVLHDAVEGGPSIGRRLAELAAAPAQPAIVRASALRALLPWQNPAGIAGASQALSDPDPLVRMAAVEALSGLDPAQRAARLAPLLDDPMLAVRLEAAARLAGDAEGQLEPARRGAFDRAIGEYTASLRFNAERPDTVVSLGDLQRARGDATAAEASYRRAIDLDPAFSLAAVHLADLQRGTGDEAGARATLENALQRSPRAAELHHALGLARVREGSRADALRDLRSAAELAPEMPHYAYVLAVALAEAGEPGEARGVLAGALERHPNDREVLNALALYEFQAGQTAKARELAARLLAIDPDDVGVRQLAAWLDRPTGPSR